MNPLYSMMTGQAQMPAEAAPETSAGNRAPMDWNAAMGQLRANPAAMLRQAGYNVPEGCKDPQAMVMHLMRSGQIGGPMMRMIGPMLQKMGVR